MTKPPTAFAALMTAIVLLLTVALPARGEKAPEQAIGEQTAFVVWLDLEQLDADLIKDLGEKMSGLADNPMLKEQAAGLPVGDIGDMVKNLQTFREGFTKAGGQGLMMTMEMPSEESWSPPIALLAKTTGNVDGPAMSEMVRTMSDGTMDAELEAIAGATGWHDLAVFSAEGDSVTLPLPTPNKDAHKAFNKQLGQAKKPILSVAFRMQEDMRQMMRGMADGAGQGGQQDPQAAMAMGMLSSLQGLDTLGFAVSKDKNAYEIDIQMVFLKPGDAAQFGQMFNSILQIAPVMLAGQLQQLDNPPDPNTLNSFFMKLMMKHNGDTLKMKLDKEFFELAEELQPMFEQLNPGAGPAIPEA